MQKKNITKKTAVILLSAMVAAQSGFPVQAAAFSEGSWEQSQTGGWKFLDQNRQERTGWVHTASGWYYLDPATGSLVTGWKNINGRDYYFTPGNEGVEGQMKVGWYQSPQGEWYFFDNSTGSAEEGSAVSGWKWIDGYCYYFAKAEEGKGAKMAANTSTPDGYKVNADGQWVNDNGTAQYRSTGGYHTKTTTGSSSGSSGSSSSGSGSDSRNDTLPVTPDTPDTPDTPVTPDTPDTPDTPVTPDTPAKEEYQYLLMNIPYAAFYEAEVKDNSEAVDGVSSATLTKPRSGSLVAGSYHVNKDGSTIDGVTFPVRVKKGTDLSGFKQVTDADSYEITVTNRGKETTTTYAGKDALFENENYAYYELSEIPSYYKELTISGDTLTFSEVKGTAKEVSGVSAEVFTSSNYGDYQLSMTGLPESLSSSSTTVYGVILHTKEGTDYGMRHLENIWLRTNIAWASGFTTESHKSPLSAEHYESMMGKNITGVTYYTSEGMMEIPFAQAVYVPVKFAQEITVAEGAKVSEKTADINGLNALPSDFEAVYTVAGQENTDDVTFEVKDGKLTWTGSPLAGKYTLTIKDNSGKYAPVEVSFILNTETSPVEVQAKGDGEYALAKVSEDTTDAQVKAYVKSITAVKVGDQVYAATGRGSVKIVKDDGTLDMSVKVDGNYVFESHVAANITILADGYPDVEGSVTATTRYQYVLMNIPYSEFFANELENNEKAVDVVSSATKKKPLSKSYTAGTYHTEADGSVISGVTYPVKIDEKVLTGLTKADSEDALYGNADYAYYVLSDTPSYYKTANVENNQITSFTKSETELETITYESDANITTTKLAGNHIMHGDYEIRFTDLDGECILTKTDTVIYGAVLHTTLNDGDAKDYGLRYQENIFHHKNDNFEIAWATGSGDGFLTTVKGAQLSYLPYEDIMGRDLTGLTVYTDQGTVEINFANKKYVPLKDAENKVSVTAPELDATETTYSIDELLFENYKVSVTDSDDKEVEGFTVDEGAKKVTWSDTVAAGDYKLVITDLDGKYAPVTASFTIKTGSVYVMMNIPYDDFYKAELSDAEGTVDAVTSATKKKAVNKTFVSGSYHTTSDDSVKIKGVTYPVKVDPEYLKANAEKYKEVTSEDALFESDDYSYVSLSDVPLYYKTLDITDGTFEEITTNLGDETINEVAATLETNGYHCAYELALDEDDLKDSVLLEDNTVVYGAVLHTSEGQEFALRHLENIWFNTELGWDNNEDGYYKDLVGQSIASITYYTSEGDVYVNLSAPVKVTEKIDVKVTVASAKASAGTEGTAVTGLDELPDDFKADFELSYSDGTVVDGIQVTDDIDDGTTTLTWTDTLPAGTYVLTVKDIDGKYAPVIAEFILTSAAKSVTIEYNKIVIYSPDDSDITSEELDAYRNSVSEVYVDGTKLWGIDGNDLIEKDGSINFDAKRTVHGQTSAVFADGAKGDYKLQLKADGYPETKEANVGKNYRPNTVVEAQATVTDLYNSVNDASFNDYTAKVKVTVNANGEVVSVEDNKTEYGTNRTFWNWAKNKFNIFTGATADTINDVSVDIASGATCSLTAVKTAVADALGAEEGNSIALVDVIEAVDPAAIKLYMDEKLVKTVEVEEDELEESDNLEILDVVLDPEYEENWKELTLVVVDVDDKVLESTTEVVDDRFTVTLANGRVITISFDFGTEEEPKTDEVVTDETTGKTSDQTEAETETTEEEKKETGSEENADDSSKDDNGSDETEDKTEETEDRSEETKDKTEETEDKSDETEDKSDEAEDKSNETEDKADETEDKSDETEDKSDEAEDKSDEAEDKSEETEDKSDEAEDKSDETEDKSETQDQDGASSSSDNKETAGKVSDAGETTEKTDVGETDTLKKDE